MLDETAAARMRRQHGLLTRRQAFEIGFSPRQVDYRVRTGRWTAAALGVYRAAAVAPSWRSRLLASCLAAGGVASHRSAAVLHGVPDFRPGRVEVTIPRTRAVQIDGQLHRTTQWWTDQHIVVDGIPCTSLDRTIVDVAAVVGRARLDDLLDWTMRTKHHDLAGLVDILLAHSRRGRDGCGKLRAALAQRRLDDGLPLSTWSRKVGRLLTDHGLPDPRYEHRVTTAGGRLVAQVDLAYPTRRLAIELDSVSWHLHRFQDDRDRWNRLTTAGWSLLVFTWDDFTRRPEKLVSAVRRRLRPDL